jgi:hypothetical protein
VNRKPCRRLAVDQRKSDASFRPAVRRGRVDNWTCVIIFADEPIILNWKVYDVRADLGVRQPALDSCLVKDPPSELTGLDTTGVTK